MKIPDDQPVHFLLVDDLEENLLALEGLLRREGLVMLKATSGRDALEILLKEEAALAILDVQMPGMDGFELAELMRGNERTRQVPIIFLTAGTADHQRRFRGYETGAVDFLQKPIEPDILRSKAEVFFELFRQRQQLARQRDELQAYAAALEKADKRKDEFLAVLAHELRNPLTPMRYGLDMIRLAPDQRVPDDLREMMDRQLTHLVRLIDDLLDVSRISRGKISLRRKAVTLQSILRAGVETCLPLIQTRLHQFTQSIPEEPIWLDGDETRLSQVIGNLLNNAAKYTPEGGRIGLDVSSTEQEAIISISDNGVGIPAEMLPRIFELFTQVEERGERSHGGLGIGLALARQLVNLHGGSLEATSRGANLGSTFTVRLPCRIKDATLVSKSRSPRASEKPLTVLVIDDNLSSAQATARVLELVGHKVSVSHDGPSGLEAAHRISPHAIILDIGMPGMSGYEVCEALRSDPLFENTLLIAQTGWGQEQDRQKAHVAGFDHHLTKPVDLESLTLLLSTVDARTD